MLLSKYKSQINSTLNLKKKIGWPNQLYLQFLMKGTFRVYFSKNNMKETFSPNTWTPSHRSSFSLCKWTAWLSQTKHTISTSNPAAIVTWYLIIVLILGPLSPTFPTLLTYAHKIPSYRVCYFPHCQRTGQCQEGQSQGTWGSVFPAPSVCKTKEDSFRQ